MIFYDSYYYAIKDLPDKQRLQCYDAIIAYAVTGKEPENLDDKPQMFYTMAKPLEDSNKERRKNGALGGRPKKDGQPPNRNSSKFVNFTQSGMDWDSAAEKIMAAQK